VTAPSQDSASTKRLRNTGLVILGLWLALIVAHYPHDTDDAVATANMRKEFYDGIYTPQQTVSGKNYVAAAAPEFQDRVRSVSEFSSHYSLQDKKVLEVGSGSGFLQDVVADYTGLHIAASAARFYHKRFVQGSATDLPFRDSTFDSVWTVFALEHVPNPEKAMSEIRRVTKPGGVIYFFAPAFNVPTWASAGYEVRPYKDLDWGGKLQKATIPIRRTYVFKALYKIPTRLWFEGIYLLNRHPTALHYIRLMPSPVNWAEDSDASNSFDTEQVELWFRSRGDECMNCKGLMFRASFAMEIKVNKP
jgi:SAM-dependent methyltransferase